jgi:hypothetical protein
MDLLDFWEFVGFWIIRKILHNLWTLPMGIKKPVGSTRVEVFSLFELHHFRFA